jgi:hypothetical protein
MSEQVSIYAYWTPLHDVKLGEYLDKLKQFLTALQKVHPIFRQLHETGNRPNSTFAIEPDLGNLDAHMRKALYDKECQYSHIASDGLPAPDSTSSIGYRGSFMSHPKNTRANDSVRTVVSTSTGMVDILTGLAHIEFPFEGAPEFFDAEFQKKLFHLLVEIYKPDHALINQAPFLEKIAPYEFGLIRLGTITYFANKHIADAIPEDIEREPFGDGVLVTISREWPDPDNARQVQAVKRVRDLLHVKGLLKWM